MTGLGASWADKSDDELEVAALQLSSYTADAQAVIRAELQR